MHGPGKELATFVDLETGFKGVASMESFEDLFPHQAKSLGEHIGQYSFINCLEFYLLRDYYLRVKFNC
jgi:hypothetical protein